MTVVDKIPDLPEREAASHKGTFGHVFVLAGSLRMTGAALLTAEGSVRGGAGLVTLGVPAAVHPLVAPAVRCSMTLPLPSTAEGTFSRQAIQPALDFAAGVDAVALGPGITTEDDTVAFATYVAQRTRLPLVLDADGLNCVAKAPTTLRLASEPRIITPHPGEAARLLGRSTGFVSSDRISAAAELSEKFGAIVVLKGHETVVTDGERVFVNRTGNPGMATGGTGDVLTGIVAALLAQKLPPFDAAVLGVHVHGRAGDLAAAVRGQVSLTAADLLDHLGAAVLSLRRS